MVRMSETFWKTDGCAKFVHNNHFFQKILKIILKISSLIDSYYS